MDVEGVLDGPARVVFDYYVSNNHLQSSTFFIGDNFKALLQDVDRAGEFYIPDKATALSEARYSHYASTYEKTRRAVSERKYE